MDKLPVSFDFETTQILKRLITAHRELALLNGICDSIPNQAVLVHTLALQEAKESSEIENIIRDAGLSSSDYESRSYREMILESENGIQG